MGRWRDGRATLRIEDGGGGGDVEAAGDVNGIAGNGNDGTDSPATASPEALPLEIAASYRARTRGLLKRDGVRGALLLTPAGSVHTFRMRFAIDVAYLDRRMNVIAVRTMKPGRLGLPRLRSRHVLETEAGVMAGWGLRPGVRISVDGQATTNTN
ncbi:DUF192 domain-containing protein [Streptomyces sp. H27-D2]|uniref:DUF192 domain-containing protein n=1 Tax=Streptomyces sp. H27-D2 TaxID=3046304 RepID=UPI002DBB839E|nr:DUF192 domain-containing protein [Streptomyces sp. H27-D2]MEC4016554.1 DUF192 domain-containing protein [Streptomyces sp. H27-D2]